MNKVARIQDPTGASMKGGMWKFFKNAREDDERSYTVKMFAPEETIFDIYRSKHPLASNNQK